MLLPLVALAAGNFIIESDCKMQLVLIESFDRDAGARSRIGVSESRGTVVFLP